MNCPNCGSDNTQRLEVAYQNGTSTIRAQSYSIGGGTGGGIGGATTTTSGTSKTLLAQRAAPPAKKGYGFPLLMAAIPAFIGTFFNKNTGELFGIGSTVLLVFLCYRAYQYNNTVWPRLYNNWRATWICHKCGNAYLQN